MKNLNIRLLLIIMILLSFFSGFPLNGGWNLVYRFEFQGYPEIIKSYPIVYRDVFFWGIIVLSHIGIVLLPFVVEQKYFKKMLLCCPLTYLLGYIVLVTPYFIILIPFMIIWIVTMSVTKKRMLRE
ncbi:hypothetical protein [Pedobacter jeongneungensis]|uniref:hypothetical protein n=1 Tax=Pedobacter jeongneungensis TaxID=947309 RepID=UPI00046A33FB|nr:hypothetical protein [Pedobacter jeongneungensis]